MKTKNERSSFWEIFLIYLKLGCMSFGGPVAHLGYFKDHFVSKRKWLDEARYAELLGICQFVPGPSSSQLGFAIGWHRAGMGGAFAAWLGFTLPSALLMIGFAYGLYTFGTEIEAVVRGLLVAAVAVVANATLSLGRKLCPDLPRIAIGLLSAACIFAIPGSFTQIIAIAIGAAFGLLYTRPHTSENQISDAQAPTLNRSFAYIASIMYASLLVISFWMNAESWGGIYALHYQAGALVFGGGHVVLPLLHDSVVAGGLLDEQTLLAGYSAAQALPGPLFTLSAFIGTASSSDSLAWLYGLGTLISIFLPGMLLLIGLLPFWNRIRQNRIAQSCLIGANAAVVGLLLAAFIYPVSAHGIRSWIDALIAALAFIALFRFKSPAWLVVLACGLSGYLIYS